MYQSILYILSIQLILTLFPCFTTANVEKTIFVAPPPSPIPAENPGLDDLGLDRLSPSDFVVRTYLNASFPTEDAPQGSESWFYLEDLNPGQRYEVRICWLATQPTAFTLTTHSLHETVSDPALLSALGAFSSARLSSTASTPLSVPPEAHDQQDHIVPVPNQPKAYHHHHLRRGRSRTAVDKTQNPLARSSQTESVLFLRVFAAADYFTLNTSMMETVPPVMVDIILDPFLLNMFPRSLVPTAVWIVVVTALAWYVGGWVVKTLSEIISSAAAADDENKAKENKRQEENKKKQ